MNTNLVSFFARLSHQSTTNDFSFIQDERNIALAWYQKFMGASNVEDTRLIDILCFFYNHIELDSYQNHRYSQLANYLYETYGIRKETLPMMLADFRELI